MQKLRKHFPAGAFPHGLLHIISQIIGIQPVSPENSLILRLGLEMGLGRHYNAHSPSGILKGHQRSGAGDVARIVFDHLQQPVSFAGHRKAFPVAFIHVAEERFRIAQSRPLRRHLRPQLSGNWLSFRCRSRCMQVAQCSGIRHTGIRHDTYVAFAQIDRGTVRKMQRCRRQRLPGCKIDIRHGTPCFKPNAVRLQIGFQWQDHALILIIRRSCDALQRFNTRELKNHAVHIAPELEQTAPFLESKGRLPHIPEIRFKEMRAEPILDGHIVEPFLRCKQQLCHCQAVRIVKAHAADIENFGVLVDQTCMRTCGMRMVKVQNFLCDAALRLLQRRNAAEQLPEIFIGLFVEHTATAADKALLYTARTVV